MLKLSKSTYPCLLQTIEAMPKLFFNAKRVEILPLAEDPEFFKKSKINKKRNWENEVL